MKRAETGILVSRTRRLTIPPASARTPHMRTARTTMIIALSVAAVALPTAAGACNPAESTATWPQTLATGEECGDSWFQVDDYKYGTNEQQATVDALTHAGVLDRGDDSSVVISWSFVPQEPCPTPTPTPTLESSPRSRTPAWVNASTVACC